MTTWSHKALVEDLAVERVETGKIVFMEVGVGSRFLRSKGNLPVCDVLTLDKSYTRPNATVFEVKVTRSDFQQDLRTGKWEKYLPISRRLYFAAPAGLIKKSELPTGVGLLTRTDRGWSTAATAKLRPNPEYTVEEVQALLMSGLFAHRRVRDLAERRIMQHNGDLREAAHTLGYRLAQDVAWARKHRTSSLIDEEAREVVEAVAEVLSLSPQEVCEHRKELHRLLGEPTRFKKSARFLSRVLSIVVGDNYFEVGHLSDEELHLRLSALINTSFGKEPKK